VRKITWAVIFFSFLFGATFSFNYYTVSQPLSEVLEADTRNSGIEINTHYRNYLQPTILVIDVKTVSLDKSPLDVFRVFLQYASKIKEKKFDSIILQSKGKEKFTLKGDYFQKLGINFKEQNPMYTMRTFPEHLYTPNGDKAFSSWTGGIFGVLKKQMEDFSEFHDKWYIEDTPKKTEATPVDKIDASQDMINF